MDRETISYIANELSTPHREEIGSIEYSDRKLYPINKERSIQTLETTTLGSIPMFLSSTMGKLDVNHEFKNLSIHIQSPSTVRVINSLNTDGERKVFVCAHAPTYDLKFNHFIDHEEFMIMLQTLFEPTEDLKMLTKFAGTVEMGTISEYGDDGVSQKATVRTGIASRGTAILPSVVTLAPFRTFPDVEQPQSLFIFRMRQSDRSGAQCALFEADGKRWENEAMMNIFNHLRDNEDLNGISIIV